MTLQLATRKQRSTDANRAMVRNSLCLDHFYVGFSNDQITDLKHLTEAFKRCSFREVSSGRDSWAGVYLYSNLGSYFEMIRGSESYGLGIACSSHAMQYVNAHKIRQEMKTLPWKLGSRKWAKTKKTWFDWLALKPLNSKTWSYQPFYSWIMHYHQNHIEERINRPAQGSIDRFKCLELLMEKEFSEYVAYHSKWLPGSVRLSSNGASLTLPNRDSGDFHINIEYSKGHLNPQFKSLEMSLCPDVSFKQVQLKTFALKKSGENVILLNKETKRSFKDY